ncbi:MAG: hypothetical protein PWP14_1967 [Methanolobus sp.]|nr:hypothetical protein [Methanolobus sp.]
MFTCSSYHTLFSRVLFSTCAAQEGLLNSHECYHTLFSRVLFSTPEIGTFMRTYENCYHTLFSRVLFSTILAAKVEDEDTWELPYPIFTGLILNQPAAAIQKMRIGLPYPIFTGLILNKSAVKVTYRHESYHTLFSRVLFSTGKY